MGDYTVANGTRNKNYSSYNVAKSKLVKALNIQPRAAYIHNALGLVYNYQEVYDSAYYHFKKAKQLINSWSSPVNNIGENLLDQYKYDEAKTELESSLGLKGSSAFVRVSQLKRQAVDKLINNVDPEQVLDYM